jgi:hypothetical protein
MNNKLFFILSTLILAISGFTLYNYKQKGEDDEMYIKNNIILLDNKLELTELDFLEIISF